MANVLYYLHDFPQLSQNYVRVELEAVAQNVSTHVAAMEVSSSPYAPAHPFLVLPNIVDVINLVKETQAQVIHSHWLYMTEHVFNVAKATGVPFTIRAHSFDVLPLFRELNGLAGIQETVRRIGAKKLFGHSFFRYSPWYLYGIARFINHPLCLGILSFPFSRENLEMAGVKSEKIVDCYPVVDFQRFYNRSPNGNEIMTVGITSEKKGMSSYIDWAKAIPDRRFNMYAVADKLQKLEEYNHHHGNPVTIHRQTPFEAMAAEYKKHEWLIYTSQKSKATVGWPIVVAEAQAAGVGVCIQNIRPDLKNYVGEAGYVFNNQEELRDIIMNSFPSHKRELGFEHARKSDINSHLHLLFNLWKPAMRMSSS